ncbi:MAG: GNAT family N-acetyltransferase, partial [Myxococcales bacterium]|nr:GNAT family N-acetyltransferase [Myxococcales bacterium]
RSQHRPTLRVGPRAASDALWSAWASTHQPRRRYDQRLYVLDDPPPGEDPPGFRRALPRDVTRLAVQAAAMEREDLGTDPRERDPASHDQVVAERVRTGRTWVIEDGDALVFQVNIGTMHVDGAQIGGTWVPPARRGRGLSTSGVAATCRHLAEVVPRVTLHVNEANTPAVRCYERVGFRREAAYRLVVP